MNKSWGFDTILNNRKVIIHIYTLEILGYLFDVS